MAAFRPPVDGGDKRQQKVFESGRRCAKRGPGLNVYRAFARSYLDRLLYSRAATLATECDGRASLLLVSYGDFVEALADEQPVAWIDRGVVQRRDADRRVFATRVSADRLSGWPVRLRRQHPVTAATGIVFLLHALCCGREPAPYKAIVDLDRVPNPPHTHGVGGCGRLGCQTPGQHAGQPPDEGDLSVW